jgi:hypothetical protein
MSKGKRIVYEIWPRRDNKGFHLRSQALPFGKLWYDDAESAASYAQFYSRSKHVEIRFLNELGEQTECRTFAGDFVEP